MIRSKTLVLAMVIVGCLVVGCNNDDDGGDNGTVGPGNGHPPTEMLGTWVFQSVTVDGVPASLADVMEWHPMAVSAEINIQTIGTYVYSELDTNGGQLWFESGFLFVDASEGEMDINVLMDGDGQVNETSPVTYTLAGGVFTITEIDEGQTVTFTLTM